MASIIIIEDEAQVASFMRRALVANSWTVACAPDGSSGLEQTLTGQYELALLDLTLPDTHGEVVLGSIMAARPQQKVMVVSAHSDVQRKTRCFELGASDYLVKPFSVDELVARVRARLRDGSSTKRGRLLHRGTLTLDPDRREANTGRGGVSLTEREFLVLAQLMSSEVCSREELLAQVWGFSFDPGSNVVDVYVRRLRVKLGADLIETVRSVGYSLKAS